MHTDLLHLNEIYRPEFIFIAYMGTSKINRSNMAIIKQGKLWKCVAACRFPSPWLRLYSVLVSCVGWLNRLPWFCLSQAYLQMCCVCKRPKAHTHTPTEEICRVFSVCCWWGTCTFVCGSITVQETFGQIKYAWKMEWLLAKLTVRE